MNRCFDGNTIPLAICFFKQPSTDKEETGQSEQEEYIIPAHPHISQTKTADM